VFSPSITLELNAMKKVMLNCGDHRTPPPPSSDDYSPEQLDAAQRDMQSALDVWPTSNPAGTRSPRTAALDLEGFKSSRSSTASGSPRRTHGRTPRCLPRTGNER
jgi:hypothetical protein